MTVTADQRPQVLRHRYTIKRLLGEGAQGITYLGEDLKNAAPVAIKELKLEGVADWKAVELFEREARALRALTHPNIPRYIDAFHLDSPDGERFFLVQEFIDGENLRDRIEGGLQMGEDELRAFLKEMLETLNYLHGLSPPVIHRDIKPSNIIARPGGGFALIDFGCVQLINAETLGGSTVVGTAGYQPPEQLLGRAQPASDLYALAATAVHLASRTPPHELPVVRMHLQIRPSLHLSPELIDLLERALSPSLTTRLAHAQQFLRELHGRSFDHTINFRDTAIVPTAIGCVGSLAVCGLFGAATAVLEGDFIWIQFLVCLVPSLTILAILVYLLRR